MLPWSLLLLLGITLGHTVFVVGLHNWFYGQNLPRHAGKIFHLLFGPLPILLPALVLWNWGPDWLTSCLQADTHSWTIRLVGLYFLICALAGFFYLPWLTWIRYFRPWPSALVLETGRIIDITEKLGYRPVGRRKSSLLAHLPGNEIFTVEMAEKKIHLPSLPSVWERLSILHISDVHLCGIPDRDYYRIVMQQAAEWEPDLVAITGDLTDTIHHQGWIVPTFSWLRWKIAAFAILGNHDYWQDPPFIRRRIQKLGIHYLGNQWQQIEVRGQPMVVIGQESPWLVPRPDLSQCPPEPFRLCLSHTPDNLPWARKNHIDLMLSGHVHGGQIRFPILGSLLVPSRHGRRYDCGTFQEGNTVMHVSRGLAGDHPIRYGCRPEVTLLRLTARGNQSPG